MATFKDFRGLEIPEGALALGFVDESWHNDAAARMTRRFGPLVVTLWIGDDDSAAEIGVRYMAYAYPENDEGDAPSPDDPCVTLYEGDDLDAMLLAASQAVSLFAIMCDSTPSSPALALTPALTPSPEAR